MFSQHKCILSTASHIKLVTFKYIDFIVTIISWEKTIWIRVLLLTKGEHLALQAMESPSPFESLWAKKEPSKALLSMNRNKASVPNGFLIAFFFQSCLSVVDGDFRFSLFKSHWSVMNEVLLWMFVSLHEHGKFMRRAWILLSSQKLKRKQVQQIFFFRHVI